jgi:hypothetical protein
MPTSVAKLLLSAHSQRRDPYCKPQEGNISQTMHSTTKKSGYIVYETSKKLYYFYQGCGSGSGFVLGIRIPQKTVLFIFFILTNESYEITLTILKEFL